MTTSPLTLKKTETAVATSQHRRPIIGIAGHMLPNGNSVGVTFPYLNYFEKFGDVKIIIPTAKQVDDTLDLLVIPGGPDISAFRYLSPDETPSWFNQKPDQMREYFDTNILPRYIENKTPIFGICRGHQSIAALFGAKLEQHLLFHEYNSEEKRKDITHQCVGFLTNRNEETSLLEINEKNLASNFGTNSMHHQAVSTIPQGADLLIWTDERLPKNRTVYSYDPKDHLMKIEGLLYKEYPIATVQFHPEELADNMYSVDLINDLIKCSKNQ